MDRQRRRTCGVKHPEGRYFAVATYVNADGDPARAWVTPEQCDMIWSRDLLAIDGEPFEYQWLDQQGDRRPR
jgi:hypothetical protein